MKNEFVIRIDARAIGWLVAAVVVLGTPAYLLASPFTAPNTFTPGTPISAGQVNANFDQAELAITDNDTRLSNLALDVVQVTGPSVACDAGWRTTSVAVCPSGYTLVGGGCTFSCQGSFAHTDSVPNNAANQWECALIDNDPNRTFHASARCARITGL